MAALLAAGWGRKWRVIGQDNLGWALEICAGPCELTGAKLALYFQRFFAELDFSYDDTVA